MNTVEKISRFGEYSGYSTERYDGWRRFSRYVTVWDGTRIAVDYYRPTKDGKLHEEKLPVVLTMNRYQRCTFVDGRIHTILDWVPFLVDVLKHGYVVAIADVRGSGASFGSQFGWFPPEEARDTHDVIEWLGSRSWSSGNVGMFGRSYLGITQLFAASRSPTHLKAIFPEVAWLDVYNFAYPGGIFNFWPVYSWSTGVRTADYAAPLPRGWRGIIEAERYRDAKSYAPADADYIPAVEPGGTSTYPIVPVDEDEDGLLLAQATQQHRQAGLNTYSFATSAPWRDSRIEGRADPVHVERSLYRLLGAIADSGIPAYHLGGWFDGFLKDTTFYFKS